MAPMRWRASSVAASTTSSTTRVACSRLRVSQALEPTRMSARRMSFWNTTTTIRMIEEAIHDSKLSSVMSSA